MDMMVKQGSQLLDLLKMSVEEQRLERLDRKQERIATRDLPLILKSK